MKRTEAEASFDFFVAAFPDADGGAQALKQLKKTKKKGLVYFEEAVVISQDAGGGTHFHETDDMSPSKGILVGAILGGVIGAIFGSVIAEEDTGFNDTNMLRLGLTLKPDTSVIVLVTGRHSLQDISHQVDTTIMRKALTGLGNELSSKLEEGKSVALGIVLTEEGMTVTKVAADNKIAEVIGVIGATV